MLHCIQAGHALDLDGPVLSGGYRRFCTAKPPPRSPYATASLRRSGSTDSTPLRPTSRRHRPSRPARPQRPDRAHRRAGWRPTAGRTAHRRAAENLPSTDPVLEAARVVAARPSPHWNQRSHQLTTRYTDSAGLPRPTHPRQRVEHRPTPGCRTTVAGPRRGQMPNIKGNRRSW